MTTNNSPKKTDQTKNVILESQLMMDEGGVFKTTFTSQKIIELADDDAIIEIQDGVYLASRSTMLYEQAKWDEDDDSKTFDFTRAPYWITTDSGAAPVAINGAKDGELLAILDTER